MRINFLRKDPREDSKVGVGVVIISGSCCIPGMKPFDEQAQRIVQQAITETGVEAVVKVMPATTAMAGGAPKVVMAKLIGEFQAGKLGVPAILVNGKPVSYGVPRLEEMNNALIEASTTSQPEEENSNE
ncbi:MAG: hypothetical protein HYY30_01315 [Chloroflexi bacterium]|nr:hypothetical protein [Chloroflexota bacterium]